MKTDFRRWIVFETLLTNPNCKEEEKLSVLLPLCMQKLPSTVDRAVKACMKFYSVNDEAKEKGAVSGKPIYSFLYDADLIFSAFMSQYGIDLTKENMHWFKFRALFKGLGPENKISEVMHIRSINLSQIKDTELKSKYRELKKFWELPDLRSDEEKETEFASAVGQLF